MHLISFERRTVDSFLFPAPWLPLAKTHASTQAPSPDQPSECVAVRRGPRLPCPRACRRMAKSTGSSIEKVETSASVGSCSCAQIWSSTASAGHARRSCSQSLSHTRGYDCASTTGLKLAKRPEPKPSVHAVGYRYCASAAANSARNSSDEKPAFCDVDPIETLKASQDMETRYTRRSLLTCCWRSGHGCRQACNAQHKARSSPPWPDIRSLRRRFFV